MEPRLSQFGPSLAWLLSKDVSATRLGNLLGTTAENIRVIAFRERHDDAEDAHEESTLEQKPSFDLARKVGVRPNPDEVVRTAAKDRELESIENEIARVVASHIASYDYADGVRVLRKLLPRIGFAGDSRRIALAALLHQRISWFLVHSGRCESAATEARMARDLWRIAYHESSEREYAVGFVQSALIGSHALLLMRRPLEAWRILDIAGEAADAIHAPMGSDPFRQRGVALFQLREDDRAVVYFRKAADAMEKLNEATTPAQLAMTGARHISLIDTSWDNAQGVLAVARNDFGDDSLEASMATHWTAASGLLTDSGAAIQGSLELLYSTARPSPQFGHQLTIRKLLLLTPDLGLDERLRRAWVRRTLYENAFRTR
jgi:hypothetical protein